MLTVSEGIGTAASLLIFWEDVEEKSLLLPEST